MAVRFIDGIVNKVEVEINHIFDHFIEILNHRRIRLLERVEEIRVEYEAKSSEHKQSKKELLGTKEKIEETLRENQLQDTQKRILAELEKKLEELNSLLELRMVFRCEYEQLELMIVNMGDILQEDVSIPNYKQMKKAEKVVNNGQDKGELSNPICVAVDENNKNIYVTEGFPARVSQFSELGEYKSYFTHKHMEYPYGITVHEDNLYVTDIQLHGVFQMKTNGNTMCLETKLTDRGSGDGQFNYPRQVAVSKHGDVFIADYNNHRIQVLDKSLRFQKSITNECIKRPQYIQIKDILLYILTSDKSPSLHVFTLTGNYLHSIKFGSDLPPSCSFFCMDLQNNILISDSKNKCIQIFSPRGEYMCKIGHFQDEDYDNPLGIALTRQLKLVVITPYDESQLQMFH